MYPRHLRHARLVPVLATAGLLVSACTSAPSDTESKQPAVVSQYACGQLHIRVTDDPDRRLLGIDYRDKRLLLKPDNSASREVFVAPGDTTTRFQRQAEQAELTIRGETFPECLPPGALERPFTAQGSDPIWQAHVSSAELVLSPPYEEQQSLRLPSELVTANRHGREFVAEASGTRATLTVANQLCQDPVTGAQFPNQVRLTINGQSYPGCGGSPLRLLRGAEWVVMDLAAEGIIDRSRLTLRFMDDNRIAGQASCNRYTGRYQLTGEGGIDVSQLATTRMACAPALMAQEARFIAALEQASKVRIGPHGELFLLAAESGLLSAFQSDHDTL